MRTPSAQDEVNLSHGGNHKLQISNVKLQKKKDMGIIHGKDIKILSGSGALIAKAKSCTIHRHADAIDVASSQDGTSKHYIAGRKEWSIDLAYFVSTDGVSLVEGQTYSISVVVGSAATWTGSVICTDCEVSAPMNNLSQGTIKLLGNGPLSTGT